MIEERNDKLNILTKIPYKNIKIGFNPIVNYKKTLCMIKLLLVDDHKIIRDGIKALFKGNDNIEIIGECNDGSEVLGFLKGNKVDVILMDINMPAQNGIDTTKQIVDEFPDMKIIALTMHNEEGHISKMVKAGAVGYVLKNTDKAELVSAVTKVSEGGNYFNADLAEIMMSKYMKDSPPVNKKTSLVSVDDLTNREIQILKLIAEEYTNNEIAAKLFISPRTVDTHRQNILQKLGVRNTAGLVRFAIQNEAIIMSDEYKV